MSIEEKLRLLREGNFSLLTEAGPTDADKDDSKDASDTKDKDVKSNAVNIDPQNDDSKDDDDSIPDPPDDDESIDGHLSDADNADSKDDDTSDDSDDSTDDTLDDTETASNSQEFIQLDDNSRKLLDYKNFQKYRDLRDDISYLIDELNELTLVNDDARNFTNAVITKATELMEKLNDYILNKYKSNSYEINYKNFMDFVLEKRLIFQVKDEVIKINIVK